MHHTMSFYEGANIIQTQVEPLKWDLNGSVFLQGSIRYRMNLIQDELHVTYLITLLIAILYSLHSWICCVCFFTTITSPMFTSVF